MMKLKKERRTPRAVRTCAAASLAAALAMSAGSANAQNVLTGDEATACEVILCLAASGAKPGACTAPLAKFFSIKKPWKRVNFLKLCPKQGGTNIDLAALVAGHPAGLEPDPPISGGGGGGGGGPKVAEK
jgi:hypothetical protein